MFLDFNYFKMSNKFINSLKRDSEHFNIPMIRQLLCL